MLILGIESSCDETAAAIASSERSVRASAVLSQMDHAPYGGVVPELASRAHIRAALPVIENALDQTGARLRDLSAIAVTQGPGLVGSLLVGVNLAKGLAYGTGLPVLGVHHLEAHLFSALIDSDLEPPFVALLVSGGHTELILVHALGDYELLGATLDDAAGEAFDKVAKLLDLLPPGQLVMGGRAVSASAEHGDPTTIRFPRALSGRDTLDMSFSGLKTSVLSYVNSLRNEGGQEALTAATPDIAACFEQAVVDVLIDRTMRALKSRCIDRVALVGGVAANRRLRETLAEAAETIGARLTVPSIALCTDNAAMVAAVGAHQFAQGSGGGRVDEGYDLDASPRLSLPGLQAIRPA